MTPAAKRRRFDAVAYTRPTADDALPAQPPPPGAAAPAPAADAPTSGRRDAQKPTEPRRTAFTWRLTLDQADQLDGLVLRLRRQLQRGRLDKADVLAALVQLADDRDEIRVAVLELLRG